MQTIFIFTQFDFQTILQTTQQDPYAPLDEVTINYISTISEQETTIEPSSVFKSESMGQAFTIIETHLSFGDVAVIIDEAEIFVIHNSKRDSQPKQESKLDGLQPDHVHTMFEVDIVDGFQDEFKTHLIHEIYEKEDPKSKHDTLAYLGLFAKVKHMLQITEVDGDGQEYGSWTGEEFLRVVGG